MMKMGATFLTGLGRPSEAWVRLSRSIVVRNEDLDIESKNFKDDSRCLANVGEGRDWV